jgi:hypothetical protein
MDLTRREVRLDPDGVMRVHKMVNRMEVTNVELRMNPKLKLRKVPSVLSVKGSLTLSVVPRRRFESD